MSKITYEQLLKEKNKYDRFDSNIYLNKIEELLSIENKEKYEHNDIVKENSLLKRELNLLKKQKNNDEKKIIDKEKLKKAISIKLQAKQDKQVNNLLNRLL